MGVLPGITLEYRHVNSDDFGGHLVVRIEDQGQACNWFGDCEDRIPSILKGWDHVRIKS